MGTDCIRREGHERDGTGCLRWLIVLACACGGAPKQPSANDIPPLVPIHVEWKVEQGEANTVNVTLVVEGTSTYIGALEAGTEYEAGTDLAGNIIRYGVGLHCNALSTCCWQLSPVAEVVGWTVLDGGVSVRQPSGAAILEDAAGDTIVNAKLGMRFKYADGMDLYAGYGRPLTGDSWYEDILRFELRLFY